MSKSQFAAHIDVVPSRITRMIADGIIGADALVGEGRSARIIVERALEQIRLRRHVGQALGNGLMTRLDDTGGASSASSRTAGAGKAPDDDVAAQIQIERLAQERRKNRLAEIDEAERTRRLVAVEELQREIGRAVQDTVNVFTGMVPDIANAFAAEHGVPQRDAIHLIRRVMNDKRAVAALLHRSQAEALPETVEVTL